MTTDLAFEPTGLGGAVLNNLGAFSGVLNLSFNQSGAQAFWISAPDPNSMAYRWELLGGSQININTGASTFIDAPVVLGGSGHTTITGTGAGSFGFNRGISGGPGLGRLAFAINVDRDARMDFFAGSFFNTFLGDVRVDSGIFELGGEGTIGHADNTLIMNGGTLTNTSDITSRIRLDVDTLFTGTVSGQFLAPITGAGGLRILSAGSPSLRRWFRSDLGFNGGLDLDSVGATSGGITTIDRSGRISAADSIRIGTRHSVNLVNDATGNSADRIHDGARVDLDGGTLSLINGLPAAAVSESMGNVGVRGMGTVQLLHRTPQFNDPAQHTELRLANLSRADRGTLSIVASRLGAVNQGAATRLLVDGAAPALVEGIVPWMTNASTHDVPVTYENTTGFRGLTDAEFDAITFTNKNGVLGHARLGLAENEQLPRVDGRLDVGSLTLSTRASNVGNQIVGDGSIKVRSGAIVTGVFNHGSAFGNLIAVRDLTFSGNEAIFHTHSSTAVTSRVSDTGGNGLTKSGTGYLVLANPLNNFAGPVTVNAGRLIVASDTALGDASNQIRLMGGTTGLDVATVLRNTIDHTRGSGALVFGTNNLWHDSSVTDFVTQRSIHVGEPGGTLAVGAPNARLRISGVISGPGALALEGGLIELSNVNNTHAGPTIVQGGGLGGVATTLSIADDRVLGQGGVILDGAVLRLSNGFTSSRDISIRASARSLSEVRDSSVIDVPAGTAVLNGRIRSDLPSFERARVLTKMGSGTLVLTGDNSFNGQVRLASVIHDNNTVPGILHARADMSTPGMLELDGFGTLRSIGSAGGDNPINIGQGGTLRLNNTAVAINQRIAGVDTLLSGGSLEIVGHASQAVSQELRVLTLGTGGGASFISLLPTPSGGGVRLTLNSIAIDNFFGNALVLKGHNLGQAPGPGVGNIMLGTSLSELEPRRGYFIDDLSSGGARFAVYDNARGFVPFTAAQTLPTGQVVNGHYELSTSQTQTGDVMVSSLRLSNPGATPLALNLGGNNFAMSELGRAGIISVGDGPAEIATTGSIAFGPNAFIYNTNDLAIRGDVSRRGLLTKLGSGTLTLDSSTPIANTLVVGEGTLALSARTPEVGLVDVYADATADLRQQTAVQSVTGFGKVRIGTGGLSVHSTNTVYGAEFAGSFEGAGPLTVAGTQFSIFGASPEFSGEFRVASLSGLINSVNIGSNHPHVLGTSTTPVRLTAAASSTIRFGVAPNVSSFARDILVEGSGASSIGISAGYSGDAAVDYTGRIVLNTSGITTLTSSDTTNVLTISGNIVDGSTQPSLPGQSAINLSGQVNLRGANTFAGNISIAGASSIGFSRDTVDALGAVTTNPSAIASGPFGKGTIVVNNTQSATVNLRADGGDRVIANPITITQAPNVTLNFQGVNDMTFTGLLALGPTGGQSRTLDVAGPGEVTLSGGISGVASILSKSGAGTLRVTGNTAQAQSLRVTEGVMLFNGMHTGGTLTVSRGAIIGGIGSFSNAASINAGGIVSPGEGVGRLSALGSVDLLASSILDWQLGTPGYVGTVPGLDVFPAGSDLLTVAGTLLTPTSGSINVHITPEAGFNMGAYALIRYTGTFRGALSVASPSFTVSGLPLGWTASVDTLTRPGIVLLRVVPAPSSSALLAIGVLAMKRRRRG